MPCDVARAHHYRQRFSGGRRPVAGQQRRSGDAAHGRRRQLRQCAQLPAPTEPALPRPHGGDGRTLPALGTWRGGGPACCQCVGQAGLGQVRAAGGVHKVLPLPRSPLCGCSNLGSSAPDGLAPGGGGSGGADAAACRLGLGAGHLERPGGPVCHVPGAGLQRSRCLRRGLRERGLGPWRSWPTGESRARPPPSRARRQPRAPCDRWRRGLCRQHLGACPSRGDAPEHRAALPALGQQDPPADLVRWAEDRQPGAEATEATGCCAALPLPSAPPHLLEGPLAIAGGMDAACSQMVW
mmetsp:Transcript_46274/g.147757  ORF Transcript_46274/g.147757 Transcript_46274/m.147757 type:complete len:296 (+) Transcript_46274:1319-2206(+)